MDVVIYMEIADIRRAIIFQELPGIGNFVILLHFVSFCVNMDLALLSSTDF